MIKRMIVAATAAALGAIATACGESGERGAQTAGDPAQASATAATSAKKSGADRNACDLLTEAEVSAAAGVPVKARETNHETGRSDCGWFGADNVIAMQLVAYWTGGREGWEIMAASRGMAKDLIQKTEAVDMDSVVKTGPVGGLGDKALFSDLLPSLVLKDNVLLAFTISPLPKPAVAFRPLATKALSRL
jgi:hypothetical protein